MLQSRRNQSTGAPETTDPFARFQEGCTCRAPAKNTIGQDFAGRHCRKVATRNALIRTEQNDDPAILGRDYAVLEGVLSSTASVAPSLCLNLMA